MKLGFVGTGNMASAIMGGVIKNEIFAANEIIGADLFAPGREKVKTQFGINVTADNKEVVEKSEVIILSVKPQFYESVITEVKDLVKENQIVITIAPGKTLAWLREKFGKDVKIVRTMPNTPAMVGAGMTAACPNEFVTTEELAKMFPDNTPEEREYYIAKAKGAVCVMKIGDVMENGEKHGNRAPDYDDWSLNADIVVYYPVLDIALELSSMGIRVDRETLAEQLAKAGCEDRAELDFQKAILNDELPYTVGGGIGQSRICMFFLRKAHIGEVQSSIWPDHIRELAAEKGILFL